MPVSFLSTTQRGRYGRYPDTLSGEELARHFHLDDDDREWIAIKRRDSHRLGLCPATDHGPLSRLLERWVLETWERDCVPHAKVGKMP